MEKEEAREAGSRLPAPEALPAWEAAASNEASTSKCARIRAPHARMMIYIGQEAEMALVLTQVYLEARQKKALAAKAKQSGRRSSDLVREAVDALLLGVSPDEIRQLDEATRRAEADIRDMVKVLDANAEQHRQFIKEMRKLRATRDA